MEDAQHKQEKRLSRTEQEGWRRGTKGNVVWSGPRKAAIGEYIENMEGGEPGDGLSTTTVLAKDGQRVRRGPGHQPRIAREGE